jgi:hypothetical protein
MRVRGMRNPQQSKCRCCSSTLAPLTNSYCVGRGDGISYLWVGEVWVREVTKRAERKRTSLNRHNARNSQGDRCTSVASGEKTSCIQRRMCEGTLPGPVAGLDTDKTWWKSDAGGAGETPSAWWQPTTKKKKKNSRNRYKLWQNLQKRFHRNMKGGTN